jgi:hypothetical protein
MEQIKFKLINFFSKTSISDVCWIWTGSKTAQNRNGKLLYGQFCAFNEKYGFNKSSLAHRIIYEAFYGEIKRGLQVDHLCNNTFCVNPFHMKAVTPLENNERSTSPTAINKRKTHCIHGHEFTPENTYIHKQRNGRHCRSCQANRMRGLIK